MGQPENKIGPQLDKSCLCFQLRHLYINSLVASSYIEFEGIEIIGFSEGSLIVQFKIFFRSLRPLTNLMVRNVFKSGLVCTDCEGPNLIGKFSIDPTFTMFKGKFSPLILNVLSVLESAI